MAELGLSLCSLIPPNAQHWSLPGLITPVANSPCHSNKPGLAACDFQTKSPPRGGLKQQQFPPYFHKDRSQESGCPCVHAPDNDSREVPSPSAGMWGSWHGLWLHGPTPHVYHPLSTKEAARESWRPCGAHRSVPGSTSCTL